MTIFDYVNAREIAVYMSNVPENRMPFLGEALFPPKKQLGLDLSWIKGAGGLPVQLKNSQFDAKATLRDRKGFSKVETEMPFFREAMRIGEKDRQELNKFISGANVQMVMPVLNKIYDDIGGLVESSRVSAELMRMQLLSTGKINVVNNGVDYSYDYNMPEEHKETLLTTAMWSHPDTCDPLGDLERWMDTVEESTGVRPTNAIMTRKTFNYLKNSAQIKNLSMPLIDASRVILTEPQVKNAIETQLGVKIAIYTKKFKNDKNEAELFFPDDTVTLIPDGNLGSTWYGTTPEESDLLAGGTDAQVEIVETGIAVTTIKEKHPVNINTVVSGIMLPSFEKIDNIFIATVHTA